LSVCESINKLQWPASCDQLRTWATLFVAIYPSKENKTN